MRKKDIDALVEASDKMTLDLRHDLRMNPTPGPGRNEKKKVK